ncbi:MAG: hypothetical protein ACI9CE_003621 [Flavobacterium sp.]|jgi:hypothetical protein
MNIVSIRPSLCPPSAIRLLLHIRFRYGLIDQLFVILLNRKNQQTLLLHETEGIAARIAMVAKVYKVIIMNPDARIALGTSRAGFSISSLLALTNSKPNMP